MASEDKTQLTVEQAESLISTGLSRVLLVYYTGGDPEYPGRQAELYGEVRGVSYGLCADDVYRLLVAQERFDEQEGGAE